MSFNISEFQSNLSRYGFLKSSHYNVTITPPQALASASIISKLSFFCENVNAPGISFQTSPIKYKGYGLTEERPVNASYDNLQAVFVGDGQGKILNIFHNWMSLIYNNDVNNETNLEIFNYPDTYYGTIQITQYDPTGQEVVSYSCHKVFPLNIGSISLGWDQYDNLVKIPVVFSYRSYNIDFSQNTSSPYTTSSVVNSVIQNNAAVL